MPLSRKIRSNEALSPRKSQKPALTIGRGQPKARSGNGSASFYKPVIALAEDAVLTTSPKKTQTPPKTTILNTPSKSLRIGRLSIHAESPRKDDTAAFFDDIPSALLRDDQQMSMVGEDAIPALLQNSVESTKEKSGDLDLSNWGLPEKVVAAYKKIKITSMFHWQAECLKQGKALDGGNLVYSAPTSAGKTLVAEILLLKRVVETKKKGLFILPFVALAREKMVSLQKMFQGSGIRVGGYMGHVRPPGGMRKLDIAVCTIEKANSLVNRMVDEGRLDQLGVVVVDELHMVGDSGRGYLIELVLTKIRYLNQTRITAEKKEDKTEEESQEELPVKIQIVGMSATLPNLRDIATWLDADLFTSDYRPVPLHERIKLGVVLYDKAWTKVRDIVPVATLKNDPDHIVTLCLETVRVGHSVLIFCPYKNWCESLAEIVADQFSHLEKEVRAEFLLGEKVSDVVAQLRQSPAGLDAVLGKTIPMGVGFHHAGLTMDEREIVEGAFRKCYLKVLIATTTLSSGVNLPARRVIIRSPVFHNTTIDVLTYYQMAGRAGRKGVDTEGESILVCKETEKAKVTTLFAASVRSVKSCMLSAVTSGEIGGKMMQAALEIIVNGAAKSVREVTDYFKCTLFAAQLGDGQTETYAKAVIDSLKNKELIQIGQDGQALRPSQLGNAVVWSGLSPSDGEAVFQELQKARLSFNLETELHILHLLTPLHLIDHVANLDWYHYMLLWERLPVSWKRVGTIVGVDEMTLAAAVRGRLSNENDPTVIKQVTCMRRFYCALILNELIHEIPLSTVALKYGVNKGMLQSLQQGASTYSGIITIFCEELGWTNLAMLIEQFQSRLMFGVQRELVELVRIQFLTARQARLLYQKGYPNLAKLATADRSHIEELLRNSMPFHSEKAEDVAKVRAGGRNILLNGLEPLSEVDAATIIISEARRLLEEDMEALGLKIADAKPADKSSVASNTQTKEETETEKEREAEVLQELSRSTTQNVAEYSEVSTSQQDVDEPLDPVLEAADDERRKSQGFVLRHNEGRVPPVENAEDEGIVDEPNSQDSSFIRGSPDIESDTDDEQSAVVLTRKNTALVDDYVISECSSPASVKVMSSSEVQEKHGAREEKMVTATFNDDFEQFLANCNVTEILRQPSSDHRSMHNHRELIPATPSTAVNVGRRNTEENTPGLFVTPRSAMANVKRKNDQRSSSNSAKLQMPVLKRQETVELYMDSRIDFDENVSSDSQRELLESTVVSSTASLKEQHVSSGMFATREEHLAFLSESLVAEGATLGGMNNDEVAREDFHIVDVATLKSSFSGFLSQWKVQKSFSLSLACEAYQQDTEPAVRIGPQRLAIAVVAEKKIVSGIDLPSEELYVTGLAISWQEQTVYFISFAPTVAGRSTEQLKQAGEPVPSVEERLSGVRGVLTDFRDQIIIAFGLKRQLYLLSLVLGVFVCEGELYDPKVASWLLDMGEDEKNIQMLASEYNPSVLPLLKEIKQLKGYDSIGLTMDSPTSSRLRASVDAVVTRFMFDGLAEALKTRDIWKLFREVEMPMVRSVVNMELTGFGFSQERCQVLEQNIRKQLHLIEAKTYELAGRIFDITSAEAVGQVLFVDLGLPPPSEAVQQRRHGRGKLRVFYSTNKEILGKIQHLHALPVLIMEHRRLQLALKSFVLPLHANVEFVGQPDEASPEPGRIYGRCSMFSVTGRIAMAEPSLQVIPKDFDVDSWVELSQSSSRLNESSHSNISKKKLRKISQEKVNFSLRSSFVPFNGCVLLSADYSQVELRVLAHLAEDERLKKALVNGGDVFKAIACTWKKYTDPAKVSDIERQQAKQICYGIIYGMGAKALADQLKTTDKEAYNFMSSFKSAYPAVQAFIQRTVQDCHRNGYVETLLGCRRYLPKIKSPSSEQSSQAERQAVNTTVQGSAANIAKAAMVNIDKRLREKFPGIIPYRLRSGNSGRSLDAGAVLVLQLHDELIYEVHEKDLAYVARLVKHEMERAADLSVPLPVKLRVGSSWGELQPYDLTQEAFLNKLSSDNRLVRILSILKDVIRHLMLASRRR